MKDDLAKQVLDELLDWDDHQSTRVVQQLELMSTLKYDHYEGFATGRRFFESLARWLQQFQPPEFDDGDRMRCLRFVLDRLVFISTAELQHAIEIVYPEILRPMILDRAHAETGIPRHQVARLFESNEFRGFQRRILVLGLSDGARLDRLRRETGLSHEQFWLSSELGEEGQRSRVEKLGQALEKMNLPGPVLFKHVLLVDDFYGSGSTLIRFDDEKDAWEGRLPRARKHMDDLKAGSDDLDPVLDESATVSIVVYVASAAAKTYIEDTLVEWAPELAWDLKVVQTLPENLPVDDPEIERICKTFYDEAVLADQHKGSAPLGYRDGALPLVLPHNTPNNSLSILWADTTENEESELRRRALFPRYERHHEDRP